MRVAKAATRALSEASRVLIPSAGRTFLLFDVHSERRDSDRKCVDEVLMEALPYLRDRGLEKLLLEAPVEITPEELEKQHREAADRNWDSLLDSGIIDSIVFYCNEKYGTAFDFTRSDSREAIEMLSFEDREEVISSAMPSATTAIKVNLVYALDWALIDNSTSSLTKKSYEILGEGSVIHADIDVEEGRPSSADNMTRRDLHMVQSVLAARESTKGDILGLFGLGHGIGGADPSVQPGMRQIFREIFMVQQDPEVMADMVGRGVPQLPAIDPARLIMVAPCLRESHDDHTNKIRDQYRAIQEEDARRDPEFRDPFMLHLFDASTIDGKGFADRLEELAVFQARRIAEIKGEEEVGTSPLSPEAEALDRAARGGGSRGDDDRRR